MLNIVAVNASNAFEYTLGLIGILGALTSFIFFLANMKIRDVTDKRLLSMAERQQRRYDRIKVILTLQAARIKDLENFARKEGFFDRAEFPETGLPSEDTDL